MGVNAFMITFFIYIETSFGSQLHLLAGKDAPEK